MNVEQRLKEMLGELQFQIAVLVSRLEATTKELEAAKKELEELKAPKDTIENFIANEAK